MFLALSKQSGYKYFDGPLILFSLKKDWQGRAYDGEYIALHKRNLLFLPTKVMNTSDHVIFSHGDGFAKKQVETEDHDSKEVNDILEITASMDNVATRWDH